MTPLLPLDDAQARLLGAAEPLQAETVAVRDAAGRWLAEPLVARRRQPWADLSAMDGFATAGTGPWRIVGESAAGHPFGGKLALGDAVRISTGAAMPAGADAVLIVENAAIEGTTVGCSGGDPSAQHVRRAGFDFNAGDPLLPAGTRMGPAQIALALAAGAENLSAPRLPRLAVFDTGDELVTGPHDSRPDRLPASNGAMVAALCGGFAETIACPGPVPDSKAALQAAFGDARDADVIVTTGGASVGEHDLVRPVLEEWGATSDFWRVAIRPGKPLLVARRQGQWILGLPGNPVSAYVTALLFLLPLLRRLAGASPEAALPQRFSARLTGSLGAVGARREFVRGIVAAGSVRPIDERDSSALRAFAAANCLIDRCAHAQPLSGPAFVEVIPLPGA